MSQHSTSTSIDKPVTINFALKTAAPQQVEMNDPDFKELTATEKLNDGGCKNRCCTGRPHVPLDLDNGNNDKVLRFMSTYCVENQRNNEIYNGDYCLDGRMRGGGGGEEEVNRMCQGLGKTECPWNSWNAKERGDAYETSRHRIVNPVEVQTYYCRSRFSDQSPESRRFEINTLKPGFRCPGDDLKRSPVDHQGPCRRKPCPDVNCLMRAFKDAQEFVDSLGKVPGMAGLGLMDPSESPYFKSYREPEYNQEAPKFSIEIPTVNSQCNAPCNPLSKSRTWSSPTRSTPFTIAVPGRGGLVREAILPRPQNELNNEAQTVETGPCGNSKCKAKRKKVVNDKSPDAIEASSKVSLGVTKKPSKRDRQNYRFHRRRRNRLFGGSSRNSRRRSPKAFKYVYFAGETYPEHIYGHKTCSDRRKRVPANMGWMWTQYQALGRLKPRVGWRPGAISRQIRELIREGKDGLLERSRRSLSPASSSDKREGRKFKTRSHASLKKGHAKKAEEEEEETEPSPTLRVQRRGDVYYLTMHPIRQESMDIPKLEESINPFQFKIVKNKDDASDNTSSTASDIDIEFSPPAAMNRLKKKPNVVHVETQVKHQEILDAFRPADVIMKQTTEQTKRRKRRKKR